MKLILLCISFIFAGCGGVGSGIIGTRGGCTGYANPLASRYVLPYPTNASYKLIQSNCSNEEHNGSWRYGYDFEMSVGSAVSAARAGTVIAAVKNVDDGTYASFNYVKIKHADDSVARYNRLKKDSVSVNVGDAVTQGQSIATVGNPDLSTIPYLHFDVISKSDAVDTVAVNFRNSGEVLPEALKENSVYVAAAFVANSN